MLDYADDADAEILPNADVDAEVSANAEAMMLMLRDMMLMLMPKNLQMLMLMPRYLQIMRMIMPTGRKGTDFTFLGENCNDNSDVIDDTDDSDDLMTHFCISLYLPAGHMGKRALRVTGD